MGLAAPDNTRPTRGWQRVEPGGCLKASQGVHDESN